MVTTIDELKKKKLNTVLSQTRGNRTLAAKKLGINVRTVRLWMKKFNLVEEYPATRGRFSYGKKEKTRQKKGN